MVFLLQCYIISPQLQRCFYMQVDFVQEFRPNFTLRWREMLPILPLMLWRSSYRVFVRFHFLNLASMLFLHSLHWL